jgi:hypothetical protein
MYALQQNTPLPVLRHTVKVWNNPSWTQGVAASIPAASCTAPLYLLMCLGLFMPAILSNPQPLAAASGPDEPPDGWLAV